MLPKQLGKFLLYTITTLLLKRLVKSGSLSLKMTMLAASVNPLSLIIAYNLGVDRGDGLQRRDRR